MKSNTKFLIAGMRATRHRAGHAAPMRNRKAARKNLALTYRTRRSALGASAVRQGLKAMGLHAFRRSF